MNDIAERTCHVKGSPRDIGLALGQVLGSRLARNIDRYIQTGPARHGHIDAEKLRAGALPWLRSLPRRFQEEFEGLAAGAGMPLQRLAEWCFVEECMQTGCSALVCSIGGKAWVARNNDLWATDMWGYVTVREVEGRVPTMSFGLEGELFTGTGFNADRLWLHYNWLPAADAPALGKPHWSCFVWLAEALETCRTIDDVETLLRQANRDGGMMLFAVDGKADESAVFECACAEYRRRELFEDWIVGTNHCCAVPGERPESSQHRFDRMEELLGELWERDDAIDAPQDLMRILADPGVEVCGEDYGTVYACVACPSLDVIWYTFGGYPAASAGAWRQLKWPWKEVQDA